MTTIITSATTGRSITPRTTSNLWFPTDNRMLAASAKPAAFPTFRIDPPSGWTRIGFGELWDYRELLYFLTWRDIKVRYKQTVLGAAWAIIQPLFMMLVFSLF